MALTLDFYKEIIEQEKKWLYSKELDLLNVYYLSEIRGFYLSKQERLIEEAMNTENPLINSISDTLQNAIEKINYYIDSYNKGNEIDLNEISDYFLISVLKNDFIKIKNQNRLGEISEHKSNLYDLRQKVTNFNNDDYIDDDFYYGGKAV